MSTAFWDFIHQGDSELLAGDARIAIKTFTDAIALYGHERHYEKWALEHRAHAHRFNSDPHSALADWDDWLGEEDKPLSTVPEISHEFFRSNAVLALGEFESAIDLHFALYETILINPYRPRPVFDLRWYHPFGDQADFIMNLHVQDCSDLLVIDPHLLPTIWLRGITKRSKDDWAGAIDDFKMVTQHDPSNDQFRKWYYCALQLQAGLPSTNAPHTLLPQSECYRFYYDLSAQVVFVSYFSDDRLESVESSQSETQALEADLTDDDEWLLIEDYSHQDGYSLSFWRPDWSGIS